MRGNNFFIYVILAIAVALSCLSGFLFIREYADLHGRGVVPGIHSWRDFHQEHHMPPQVSDVEQIEEWMTFQFVNKVFLLPPEYLNDSLHLASTTYPRATVERVAKEKQISTDVFLKSVKEATRQYIASTTTK